MKILEFKDTSNIKQAIPLFKSFFHSVSYPLFKDGEYSNASLYTNDNRVLSIPGTDFRLVTDKSRWGYGRI